MSRLVVPSPLAIDWEMKDRSTAETSITELADGRRELCVRHEILQGVTPAMLVWWFRNFDGTMIYKGQTIPMYRLWHPRDHISIRVLEPAPRGPERIGPGALIEICERLLEPRRMIARIVQLDEDGFNIQAQVGGIQMVDHKHHFSATPEGTRDVTRTVVGSRIPLIGRLLSSVAKTLVFTPALADAYFRHGVEEVGNFQFFLPDLYRQRNRSSLEFPSRPIDPRGTRPAPEASAAASSVAAAAPLMSRR
jgi:hypothetical protein